MKRILTIALILVLALSLLTACGATYDKEFAIKVGESFDWMPFGYTPGAFFSNSNDSIVELTDNGEGTASLVGIAAGQAVITATFGNNVVTALIKVGGNGNPSDATPWGNTTPDAEGRIHYKYIPPAAIHYEAVERYNTEAYKTEDVKLYAYLDGGYTHRFITTDGQPCWTHLSGVQEYYINGGWKDNPGGIYGEKVQEAIDHFLAEPPVLYTFNGIITTHGELDPNTYYTGNEKHLDITCWVFEVPEYGTYWVNPANGHTLKTEEPGADGEVTVGEVIVYDPDFKEWPDGWKP